MPNRIIRESSRTSPTLDQISAEAERLFWRLITVADDHGRFEADPRILRATCFPLKDDLKTDRVARWFLELVNCGLVLTYAVNGKQYGEFTTWRKHQRIRAEKSKYPDQQEFIENGGHLRTSADKCQQVMSNAPESTGVQESRVESTGVQEINVGSRRPRVVSPNGFDAFWALKYSGAKGSKAEAVAAYKQVKPPPEALEILEKQIQYKEACDKRGIFCSQLPHLHRWFRKRRWEDELPDIPWSKLSPAERLWAEAQMEKQGDEQQ